MLNTQTKHRLPKLLLRALGLIWIAAATVASQAQSAGVHLATTEEVVTLDPNNTKVEFTLGDVLHTVHGVFKLKTGVIRFDPKTGTASGALVVDSTSGDSGSKGRDKKMNRDILESDQYSEIVFVPRRVSGSIPAQGASQVTVDGVFRLHGSEHPLSLIVPLSIADGKVELKTQFVVPYQAWGLKNPSTFILRVSDKVEIGIASSGRIVEERASLGK